MIKEGRKGRKVCYDQSTLWRTRLACPDMGFLTTIQNMTEVARLSAYLHC